MANKIENILRENHDYLMETCGAMVNQDRPNGEQLVVDVSSYHAINNEVDVQPIMKELEK